VEKVAAEAGFTLLALSPSSILSKWWVWRCSSYISSSLIPSASARSNPPTPRTYPRRSGESEKALQLAFDVARTMAPSIIFFDEVDALGQARGGAGDDASSRRLLTELLLQMNGLAGEEGVYVFGATNRMGDCDAALLRRFERWVGVSVW
jgi:hypothetical protein